MTVEEIEEQIQANIEPAAKMLADCAMNATPYMGTSVAPESFLASSWVNIVAIMQYNPSMALVGLRSIALCMRATGFQKSEMYLDAVELLTAQFKRFEALDIAQQGAK